jgi:hypothetical protein
VEVTVGGGSEGKRKRGLLSDVGLHTRESKMRLKKSSHHLVRASILGSS